VSQAKVNLYYKNVTAEVIGDKHGITAAQFEELAEKTGPVIAEVNRQRQAGRTPYRDLPRNRDYVAQVREIAAELKDRCEIFVVLGIGGSALGNIALPAALRV